MDFRGDGGAVVCHRHRLGALANRLRGSGEPGDGVEEGVNLGKVSKKKQNFLGKVSKIGQNSLEKCQKDMLFVLDNVKIVIFAH